MTAPRTDLRLVVVCRPENLAGLAVPGNVEVLGTRFNAEHMWSELAAEMRARGMI